MPFTEEQKKISAALVHGPRTAEELAEETGFTESRVAEEIKGLMKLKLVSREGFPTKYKIDEKIWGQAKKRREVAEADKFRLRMNIIIEVQGILEELVEKQLKDIEKKLKEDEDFTVYSAEHAETAKEGEHFTGFIEVGLTVRDFRALMKLVFSFGPSSIEVLRPEKIDLTLDELQDGLHYASEMVQSYVAYIAQKLTRDELERFNKDLFGR